MVESYPKQFCFCLNAQVYTCLMSTCIWSGDLPKAFLVYEQMLQDGCVADGKTYDTLLFGCVKHGDPVRASQVVVDAFDAKWSLNPKTLEAAVQLAYSRGELEAVERMTQRTQPSQSCRRRGVKKQLGRERYINHVSCRGLF